MANAKKRVAPKKKVTAKKAPAGKMQGLSPLVKIATAGAGAGAGYNRGIWIGRKQSPQKTVESPPPDVQEDHPFASRRADEKVAYLKIVAAMAAVDGEVDDAEIAGLRKLCRSVGLSGRQTGEVLGYAEDPDDDEVDGILCDLAGSDLRYTLYTEVLLMAKADGAVDALEECKLDAFASKLHISAEQQAALRRYADAVEQASEGDADQDTLKELGGELAGTLAAVGVPVAAVASAGSVAGLSAAGITSGLAALGMGLGMVSGIGTVAVIGIASYAGAKRVVRWLTGG